MRCTRPWKCTFHTRNFFYRVVCGSAEPCILALFVRSPFPNPFPFALVHSFSLFLFRSFFFSFFFPFLFAWPRSPWSLDRRFLFSILIHRRWPVDGKKGRATAGFLWSRSRDLPWKLSSLGGSREARVEFDFLMEKGKRDPWVLGYSAGNDSNYHWIVKSQRTFWSIFMTPHRRMGSLLSCYEEINEKLHVSWNSGPFLQ